MYISPSTTAHGAKPFCSQLFAGKWQRPRPPTFISISCRATKFGRDNENPIDFYKVLSLNHDDKVGIEDIKRAYRNMARQYHPDVCDPSMKEEMTKMFVRVHKAYKTLSDPTLRSKYDYELGFMMQSEDQLMGSLWRDQIEELKRSSSSKKEGSWGSRMRAQNKQRV